MIDLAQLMPCECGDPGCDYNESLPISEEHQAIAEALVLNSPLLRLIKERNEAREMVKRLLYTAQLGDNSKDKFDAVIEAHKAVFAWKGGAQ